MFVAKARFITIGRRSTHENTTTTTKLQRSSLETTKNSLIHNGHDATTRRRARRDGLALCR